MQQAQQRALAATIGANQGHPLTHAYLQIDVPERLQTAPTRAEPDGRLLQQKDGVPRRS